MAAETALRLGHEDSITSRLKAQVTARTSGRQTWQRETGFSEMFLAYFYECDGHLTASKSYRDFLYEVLSLHQKHLRELTPSYQPENVTATKHSPPSGAVPMETVTEEQVLPSFTDSSVLPEQPRVALVQGAASCQQDGAQEGIDNRLLPCLSCLQWFTPEQRHNHHCVPSTVALEPEQPRAPPPVTPPTVCKEEPVVTEVPITSTQVQTFNCGLCVQRFANYDAMLHHQEMDHDDDEDCFDPRKRFKCRHCDKRFDSSYKLNRHARVHSGERPFACAHCPKTFSRKEHHSRHLKQVHLQVLPTPNYACSFCSRVFQNRQARVFHERAHTAEQKSANASTNTPEPSKAAEAAQSSDADPPSTNLAIPANSSDLPAVPNPSS